MSADTENKKLEVVEGDIGKNFEDLTVGTTIFDAQDRLIDANTDSTSSGSKKNNLIQFESGSNKKVYFIVENLIAKFRLYIRSKTKNTKKDRDNRKESDETLSDKRLSDYGNEK